MSSNELFSINNNAEGKTDVGPEKKEEI